MTTKSRIDSLEKKIKPKAPFFVVWCANEETEEEAWQKAFGDRPMPEDDLVIYVRWFSSDEPKRRGLIHNDR